MAISIFGFGQTQHGGARAQLFLPNRQFISCLFSIPTPEKYCGERKASLGFHSSDRLPYELGSLVDHSGRSDTYLTCLSYHGRIPSTEYTKRREGDATSLPTSQPTAPVVNKQAGPFRLHSVFTNSLAREEVGGREPQDTCSLKSRTRPILRAKRQPHSPHRSGPLPPSPPFAELTSWLQAMSEFLFALG